MKQNKRYDLKLKMVVSGADKNISGPKAAMSHPRMIVLHAEPLFRVAKWLLQVQKLYCLRSQNAKILDWKLKGLEITNLESKISK